MSVSCEPNDLIHAARCLSQCIPGSRHKAIQTYLLARIAEGSLDPTVLMNQARCLSSCVPPGKLQEIKTWLMCQVVDNLEPPPIPPPEPCYDADAEAFCTTAAITNTTNQEAICYLVTQLKALPAVGTKYWNRHHLLYPFVSNPGESQALRGASHSRNLINPALYQITYRIRGAATAISHSDYGIYQPSTSNTVGAWADTNWQPGLAPRNDVCYMVYLHTLPSAVSGRSPFGCIDFDPFDRTLGRVDITPLRWFAQINELPTGQIRNLTAGVVGAFFQQRISATQVQLAAPDQTFLTANINSLADQTQNMGLLCTNAPVSGGASNFADCYIIGFAVMSKLTEAERVEYKSIWDEFQFRLATPRDHP